MSFESLEQNFSNATGLIIDRTTKKPTVLGQAFIVSKSRAVACATSVFNYTEAPWALAISFPHPDLILGIKAIALHPDFDKKEARTKYLARSTKILEESRNAQLNDLATLVLDAQLTELNPEKMGELHRALSVPFSATGSDASGVVKDGELVAIINTILQSGRSGLLTLYDQFNIAIACLQFGAGSINKVCFNGMVNEMAFLELVWRSPAHGFAFQVKAGFNWGELKDITAPAAELINEAMRRAGELPGLIAKLGGPDARYQKAVQQFDLQSVSEGMQWLVDRLWSAVDGYITVDKLPERVGADTYSIVYGLRELANRGVITLLNRATPFACGGKLGSPLISHTDFDINAGDSLTAFYLDPLSGAPVWRQGNFAGVASVLMPKNLLHTIPILSHIPGALILKDYKLVGVHNGAVPPKPNQSQPGQKLFQMIWIGALLDMTTKKLRAGEGSEDNGEQDQGISGLRSRSETDSVLAKTRQEKHICPRCYAANTQPGTCFNCGTLIEPTEPEPELSGLPKIVNNFQIFKEKYGITNGHLAIACAIVVGFPLFGMMFCTPPIPEPSEPPPAQNPASTHPSSESAIMIAVENGGFKGTAPPGYWYEDTAALTKPAKSFGLYSVASNQKLLFVLIDDLAPLLNLKTFITRPLYTEAKGPMSDDLLKAKVDEGSQICGSGNLTWFVGRYQMPNDEPPRAIFVGSLPAKDEKKSFLVIGQALNGSATYDYKSALWVIDQMAEEMTNEGNKKRLAAHEQHQPIMEELPNKSAENLEVSQYATDEEIQVFLQQLEMKLSQELSIPEELQDELKKKKSKKLKVTLTVGIDHDGNIKKMEITEPSEVDKVNNALIKDVNSQAPFVGVPKTKTDLLMIVVNMNKDQVRVRLP